MEKLNGRQLYGFKRLMATWKMGGSKALKGLTLKQKLALNYVSKESKLTRLNDKIYSNTFTPFFPSPAYDRFLKGVLSVTRGTPLPVVANFAVTPRCPCRCWHCSFADRSKRDELPLDRLQKAIAEVQDMGTSVIGITGGEPLLRKDLEEILASIDKRSMPLLFTTGYKLTIDRVRRLKQAGLEIPVISLDHYRPEIHDKGRRKEGMYAYALNAIELFRREGFYVAVSFVPNRALVENRTDLFKTIDFFRDLGVNDMRLTSPILSGHLTGHPEELLTPENRRTIFEIQKKCTNTPGYPGVFAYDFFESRHFYGCGAGFNYMFIDSRGNVSPCDFTMLTFGNIQEEPIREIWKRTSQKFRLPGQVCYANKCASHVEARESTQWPLSREASEEIVRDCPPFEENQLPEFYKRMGGF
ncbi:MAG: radical SAM protein [Desulfobacterales bacterium]|nr:radical SAM protein [Desulfobacterales bacterium]